MMQSRRNAMHVPDRPGIYKLYARKANGDLKLVYIGRATSLRQRVTTHNKPLWDECTFEVVTDETIRKLMEKHLISEFAPPYNKLEYGDPFDSAREEQALWTFLEEDRFLSLNELADELGESPRALEDVVDRLCEDGLVETKDADGKTLYNISGAIEFENDVATVVDDDRFTPSEQEILDVLLDADTALSNTEIADRAGKPEKVGSVRKLISDIQQKIDLTTEQEGRTVRYQLPDKVRQQLSGGKVVQDAQDIANVVDDPRFNKSEKELLSAFVRRDEFLSYKELADEVGRPEQIKTLRSRVSDLSDKVEFETQRKGRYVEYKLADTVRQQVAAVQQAEA